MIRPLLLLTLLICLSSCNAFKNVTQPTTEFRGFWVATVVNIDWPKHSADNMAKKKADFLKILDFYEDLNFNTAIVQVRTAGDAFYKSNHAPWSRFLTGTEGTPPNSQTSLLEWMINETHQRGMEFHAWLNPYRATFDLKTEILSDDHDYNVHPEWMLKYGKKYYYNPGLPEVQEHMTAIIEEIVTNFDIDGVHYDDYFYPYTIKNEVFNDEISFYNCALPDQNLADWRRSNIDSLIKKSYDVIKDTKPWVQFGVSPFGVWKNKATDPKGSDTRAGQTTYDNLYADPLLWMQKGWLDYIVPQVYWSMDLSVASHEKIVNWWANNTTNTNLYIGNGPYKIRNNSDKAWDDKKELPNQIALARETNEVQGNVFFSAKSLMAENEDVVQLLKRKLYKYKALHPSPITKPKPKSVTPTLTAVRSKNQGLELTFLDLESYHFAYIYPEKDDLQNNKKLLEQSYTGGASTVHIKSKKATKKKRVRIVFTDKYGSQSEPIIVHLNQTN